MSEAKCPLCGGDLIQSEEFPCFYSCQSTNWKSYDDKLCELDDCAASVPVWEALRRTRKALDEAIDVIQTVAKMSDKLSKEYGETLVEQLDNIQAYCWQEGYVLTHEEDLEKALTALEQKDK